MDVSLDKVVFAINNPGSHPEYHYRVIQYQAEQWPTFWKALLGVLKEYDDPEYQKAAKLLQVHTTNLF